MRSKIIRRRIRIQSRLGLVRWRTHAGMAKAVLDVRALETIPMMEYRKNRVLANEELQRGSE